MVNTFVVFLARVVGYFIDRVVLKNERGMGIGYYVTVLVCEIIFGILASIIVAWFSRQREYRADAGSAHLMGACEPMIARPGPPGWYRSRRTAQVLRGLGHHRQGRPGRDVRLAPADPGPHRGAAASPSGLSPAREGADGPQESPRKRAFSLPASHGAPAMRTHPALWGAEGPLPRS